MAVTSKVRDVALSRKLVEMVGLDPMLVQELVITIKSGMPVQLDVKQMCPPIVFYGEDDGKSIDETV